MPKKELKPQIEYGTDGPPRRIVEKRLHRRVRQIAMDHLSLRKIRHGLQLISHPKCHIVKLQKERAAKIVVAYLRKMKNQNAFFGAMRESIDLFMKI